MLNLHLNLTKAHKKSLIDKLADEQDMQATACILQVTVEAIRGWVKQPEFKW
jgi:hypothetical protein